MLATQKLAQKYRAPEGNFKPEQQSGVCLAGMGEGKSATAPTLEFRSGGGLNSVASAVSSLPRMGLRGAAGFVGVAEAASDRNL